MLSNEGKPDIQNRIVVTGLTYACFLSDEEALGAPAGTIGYIDPEALNRSPDKKIDWLKCDIYSLGVTMYFLMSGEKIFHDEGGDRDLYLANRECRYKLPNTQFNSYSKPLRNIIMSMIARCPSHRPSLKEILNSPILDQMEGVNKAFLGINGLLQATKVAAVAKKQLHKEMG